MKTLQKGTDSRDFITHPVSLSFHVVVVAGGPLGEGGKALKFHCVPYV